MIESCSKKQMLLAVIFLGGLTVFVLVVESRWTSSNRNAPQLADGSSAGEGPCWLRENYTVVEPCHQCSDFELASKISNVCVATNFKEVLRCKTSGLISRSCAKVTWLEERNFWLFEGLMLVLGVISTTAVFARQKVLDIRMMRRIQRQLANSV
ncbi:protein JTB [Bacillus rossius redtenbacheri]|uniref:protein JTB n=1 Tax=Bacillus rossius redtenbacheri TaxID=93214 RepID=UPI002FDD8144